MSENLVIISSAEQARQRYMLKAGHQCQAIKTPSIVSGGDMAWVVASRERDTLHAMRFGFTPHRSETRRDLLNLRTDTVSRYDDDSEYDRLMGVFMKPDFSEPIRAYRCLVLVDAFLVTSPENVHYLIHMKNKERPFALAGIYDHWKDPSTGKSSWGFTLLTATANPMIRRVGVNLMPVIVAPKNLATWLDPAIDRRRYLPLIHTFPDDLMNGYRVSSQVFSGFLTAKLLQPMGRKLKPE